MKRITDIVELSQILGNTEPKVLYQLFKTYTDKLVENTKDLGIFAVEDGYKVFNASDIRKTIKEM